MFPAFAAHAQPVILRMWQEAYSCYHYAKCQLLKSDDDFIPAIVQQFRHNFVVICCIRGFIRHPVASSDDL